jgi:hypothetical protein
MNHFQSNILADFFLSAGIQIWLRNCVSHEKMRSPNGTIYSELVEANNSKINHNDFKPQHFWCAHILYQAFFVRFEATMGKNLNYIICAIAHLIFSK